MTVSREALIKGFKWRTMEGEILTLKQMKTGHIFNSMKMIFNHVASAYRMPTIWFKHRYSDYQIKAATIPKNLVRQIYLFVTEIELRGDLPVKYREPYQEILSIIHSGCIKDPEKLLCRKQIELKRN